MVGIVLGGGGGKDGVILPALSNPAVAGNVLKDKDFINAANERVVGTINSKAAQTYTPGTSAQTIAAGQYLAGPQTIAAVQTQSKTVAPSAQMQTVYPDSGKFLSSVTVNAAKMYMETYNFGSYLRTLGVYEIPFIPQTIAIVSQEDAEDVASAMDYNCVNACFWGSTGDSYFHAVTTSGSYYYQHLTWNVFDGGFEVTTDNSNYRFSGRYLIIAIG